MYLDQIFENLKIVEPGLYLVPTPIGNLEDISLRALSVLKQADVILCEDTRMTSKLIKAYSLGNKVLKAYHDHSKGADRSAVLNLLDENKIVALVSDAGTPLISDPGYKLVREVLERGGVVVPLPGANAVLPAIQLSGLPSDKFTFHGFLPHKQGERRNVFNAIKGNTETHVFYESATRVEASLDDVLATLGDRELALVREISKLYEESRRGLTSEVLQSVKDKPVKGEIVLVIAGAEDEGWNDDKVKDRVRELLKDGVSAKDISEELSQVSGRSKKQVYGLVLELKD